MSRWAATVIGAIGIALWATETALVSFTGGLPTFEIVGVAFAAAALLSPFAWWISGDSPALAFRQPWSVWAITVPSLVCYHACIYFAVHRVPAAPAALLQGCTPLFIVFGSALLPGQRLRWWHVAGVVAGLEGLICLSLEGRGVAAFSANAPMFLVLIGVAAGLWGIYSLVSSRFGSVPTSAMGVFYAASGVIALVFHSAFEQWVTPTPTQWAAVAALGLLPMGLALFCWDYGLKKGDVQALGAASYVEPLIGAALVVVFGQGELRWSMMISGLVIIGGAFLGSASFLEDQKSRPRKGNAGVQRGAERHATVRESVYVPAWLPSELQMRIVRQAATEGVPIDEFIERCLKLALPDETFCDEQLRGVETVRRVDALSDGRNVLDTLELAGALRNLVRSTEAVVAAIEGKKETSSTVAVFRPVSPANHRRNIHAC